jgi:hypothetical protein
MCQVFTSSFSTHVIIDGQFSFGEKKSLQAEILSSGCHLQTRLDPFNEVATNNLFLYGVV